MIKTELRLQRSGFDTWPGHCVGFLSKTLYIHCVSCHPGVQIGQLNCQESLMKC